MAAVYISTDIKKIFIAAFREIFADDADFPYNKTDPKAGKVLISTKYTTPEAELQVPQIIIPSVNYNAQTLTFGNNFDTEIPGDILVNRDSQKKYSNVINFSMGIECVSSVKAEAETIVDKLFNFMTMNYAQLFTELNMNIRGVSVNEAIPRAQFPQTTFSATIVLQGDFVITWTVSPNDNSEMLAEIKYGMTLI